MPVVHAPTDPRSHAGLKALVGSGDKIILATVPFLAAGVVWNVLDPAVFDIGGPPLALLVVASAILAIGVVVWLWSVVLVLVEVPRGELITTGPFSLVKHPLYTAVMLLVVPWVGVLCNTWMAVPVGLLGYLWSRHFAPEEEAALSKEFGGAWTSYCRQVKWPWL
jgi:protein-S-isoprenylcysteine O-methyltransferase Ste14